MDPKHPALPWLKCGFTSIKAVTEKESSGQKPGVHTWLARHQQLWKLSRSQRIVPFACNQLFLKGFILYLIQDLISHHFQLWDILAKEQAKVGQRWVWGLLWHMRVVKIVIYKAKETENRFICASCREIFV